MRTAQAAIQDGFSCLKLKVALSDHAPTEIARIRAVDAVLQEGALPASVRLRLDANGRWPEPVARRVLEAVADLRIEWVEEPVAFNDAQHVRDFASASPLRIAVDETIERPGMLEALHDLAAPVAYVFKPSVMGGLEAVGAAIRACQAAGADWVVTSSMETGIGLLGAAHLVASLDGPLPACGLATLGEHAAETLRPVPAIAGGILPLPPGPGLGARHRLPDGSGAWKRG